ncbi:MAG: XrtA/PEP-CTERM system exopolysaccharide export protein [Acidiferrobacter sp.]
MKLKPLVATLALIGLSACAEMPMHSQSSTQRQAANVGLANKPHYRLAIADVVDISVWHNKRLSEIVPVRPDGRVSMPLIGAVDAAGYTPSDVAHTIQKKLAYYVRDPQVTVIVTQVSDSNYLDRVRVTGAVQRPTSINYEPGMTVLDAVLDAGGINSFAAANDTEIHRQVGKRERVIHVQLGNILSEGRLGTDYRLRPGDVVTVPQRLF